MIQAKLLVIGGEVETEELVLQLPATIGRSRESTINLSHPLVSRQHCELFEADGCLMVRDLDSLNGTFVGSQRISESVVRPGDLLTVGTVTFRAIYDPASGTNGDHPPADAAKEKGLDTSAAELTLAAAADLVTIPNAGGLRSTEIMPDPDAVSTIRLHIGEEIASLIESLAK